MTKSANRRQKVQMPRSITKKFSAALSMLLISAIMLVSSTYAWFTLSTAPEVTGITTNVGANGNLEIALLNSTSYKSTADDLGIISQVGDSSAVSSVTDANEKWGNLVDLTDSSYGLSSITLMPSRLNYSEVGNSKTVNEIALKAPSYGSDGRVIDVKTDTYYGQMEDGSFIYDSSAAGVRAIGTTSGVTVRISTYRSALSAASTAVSNAQIAARTSLESNAQDIATLMIAQVQGTTSFDVKYLDTMQSIITGVTTANGYAETAIKNAVLAYSLSGANTSVLADADVTALQKAVEDASISGLTSVEGVSVPSGISSAISVYADTASALSTAQTNLTALRAENNSSLTWNQINGVLGGLVDKNNMTINGSPADSAHKDEIIGGIITDLSNININVEMNAGSGVYYNIASMCDNYTVSTTCTVEYEALPVPVTAPVTMQTKASNPSMKTAISAIQTAGAPQDTQESMAAESNVVLSDTYGYALDFGFRTNASDSELLLQTAGAQRVYSDSTESNTQGSGSYMQFTTANTTTFSVDEVRALMSAIRVAFVSPTGSETGGYTMLGLAALDIEKDWDSTAGMYTYDGGTISTTTLPNDTLKANLYLYNYTVDEATNELILGDMKDDQSAITALVPDVAKKVTAIVYLDGDLVDNTMVANANQSMSGSLNLQFSSSATLQPMENTGMRSGGLEATDTPTVVQQSKIAEAGETYSFGGITGTVKEGYVITKGSDGNYYYSKDNGQTYTKMTTTNATRCIQINTSEVVDD